MKWNLNDVSYLFKLPEGSAEAPVDLLGPRDQGASGLLLPAEVYKRIPTLLIGGNGNATLYKDALRVVAARIDPCPKMEASSCAPEIRLVWQPVEYDQYTEKWLARDAALHCFYKLSQGDFALLKQDLWHIKEWLAGQGVDTRLEVLDVHPALKDSRTSTAFSEQIQQTILKYTGHSNLEKITYVALMTPKQWWRFGSFDKGQDGKWRETEIPLVDMPTEDIFNVAVNDGVGLGAEKGIDAVFNILSEDYPEADNIFTVINKGYRFNDQRDKPVFREKLSAVARFQNPHATNPDNLDCASCHYADATKQYIANRFPQLDGVVSEDRFINPDAEIFNLENRTVASMSGRNVRAFGFFDDKPVINQRTINESATSADWLNRYHKDVKPVEISMHIDE